MFFNTVTLWNKDKMIFKIFDIIELIEVYELHYALKFFVLPAKENTSLSLES